MKLKSISRLGASIPLLMVSLLSVIPFYFIVSLATHATNEIYRGDILIFGDYFTRNIQTIIKGGFMRYYQNSAFAAFVATLLCLFINSLAAYGIVIYRFRAKKLMIAFVFATMMIPGQIGIIGYVIEMRNLGLTDSLWSIILNWGASSYAVYFMMQYMKTGIPIELIESARIDGCGELKTYFMIGLPMIRPAVGALSMLCFLWSWNSLLVPSTLLNKSAMFTIPIGIQTLATAYTQDWGARAVALAIAVLPIIAIFSIGSKYFIRGLSAGAIKG
jgi:multiple sugar transport system permease protein/cellobiose transport system permease protein